MPTTRPRRIVRRAVIALVIPPVLLVCYISAFGFSRYLDGAAIGRGHLGPDGLLYRVGFAPIHVYVRSDLPGSFTLKRFGWWCYHNGAGRKLSWRDAQRLE